MSTAEALEKARPRLREPGLSRPRPGTERYRVAGGGAIVISLGTGDRVTVVDREGRQPCELVPLDAAGRPDTGALGVDRGAEAHGLRAALARRGDAGAARLRSALEQRGVDPAAARAVALFGHDSPAGDRASFEVQRDVLAVVCAPGEPRTVVVDGDVPATALDVVVERSTPAADAEPPPLPDPLADPSLDLRVAAATAESYVVKAGDYIQIIDVAGRECSDFQAFSAAPLERGIERSLDPTTTRTLMGAAYPGPGLFSKFFDQDMEPLVEVIRDTVGRHDTFGLACNPRYYEDQGYFGHPNCTENFNRVLAGYGVAARRGWPAINFFYNTRIDENNVLYLDEPWSRPGDYVLLRALTDIVCASSACPDDTSAANAWNPTDIHVRVYPSRNLFSKAFAYRMTPDADAQLTRETGFHPRTSQHTRRFSEYRGYWLPTSYTDHGAIDEYWACREKAVIMDLSPLRKFEVLGPDAEALLQWTLTRNVRRIAVGQVAYTAMCYPHGGMVDDGTVFRLGDDNFRWVGGDDYSGIWLRKQAGELGLRAWVKSSTDHLHNVAVQGPASREIMKEVVWTPPAQPALEELEWFRFTVGRIGDFHGIPILVSRTGYTGELGYEVWCHPDDAPAVWDAIWEAGQPHGLVPFGLDALDMVRIESGLIFYGHEFTDEIDPMEAGIGFTVPLKTKQEDFVGREALLRRKQDPQRKLVGLELEGDEVAAHGDCVHVGRAQVGVITSGTRSPILKKNIALCRMDVTCSEPGTEVEVGKLDGHQKRLPAVVVPFPFYDPEKKRVRA